MSLSIEELIKAIEAFNDDAEDNLDERFLRRKKLMGAAGSQQQYDDAFNLDGETLYDFMFCVQEGDPRTGALEAQLTVGLAEFVQDDVNETRSKTTWLVFNIRDELFRIEGRFSSAPVFDENPEIKWDYSSLRKVEARKEFVAVTTYL